MKANNIDKRKLYSLPIKDFSSFLDDIIKSGDKNLEAILRPDNSVCFEIWELKNPDEVGRVAIYDLLDNVDMDYYSALHTKNEA